jgi:hypothetical protein
MTETSTATTTKTRTKTKTKTVTRTGAAGGASTRQAAAAAHYGNCDAARAAGAAPVYRGDPGYGSHLDRDGDGVACEY